SQAIPRLPLQRNEAPGPAASDLPLAAAAPAQRRAGAAVPLAGAPCWRCSAVREPAGAGGPAGSAGPGGDQVEDEQQDGGAGDGGEPGGQVEEPVQGVDVEQAGGCPAAAQRPGDADHAGQDEAL